MSPRPVNNRLALCGTNQMLFGHGLAVPNVSLYLSLGMIPTLDEVDRAVVLANNEATIGINCDFNTFHSANRAKYPLFC